MPTIKGPIKVNGGFTASSFIKDKLSEMKIKPPFAATGFKSTKTPNNVDLADVHSVSDKKQTKKKK